MKLCTELKDLSDLKVAEKLAQEFTIGQNLSH